MEYLGVMTGVDAVTKWCGSHEEKRLPASHMCEQWQAKPADHQLIMPTMERNIAQVRISRVTVFMKLNANSGYWQVPLSSESQDLTMFTVPLGRKFTHLQSRLHRFFQQEMLHMLEQLDKWLGTVSWFLGQTIKIMTIDLTLF